MTDAARPERRSKRARRLLAIAAGLVLSVGAAEAILRVTHAGVYARRTSTVRMVLNKEGTYWTLDPGSAIHRWDGDPYGHLPPGAEMSYEINGMGMRGPLPAPGKRTVVVLGDSFTFGEGVLLEDTFVARLGKRLGGDEPANTCFVNAGISAFGTEQEAQILPRMLDRFAPKAVVVVFVPNDPIAFSGTRYLGNGLVLDEKGVEPAFRVGDLCRRVLGLRARNEAMESWYLSFYAGERRPSWLAARARLEGMAQAVRARGAKFAVVYFPLLYRLDEDPLGAIRDEVSVACARAEIPFLDLTPALAGESDVALAVHPGDRHPSRRAHELAAAAMEPFVERLLR